MTIEDSERTAVEIKFDILLKLNDVHNDIGKLLQKQHSRLLVAQMVNVSKIYMEIEKL